MDQHVSILSEPVARLGATTVTLGQDTVIEPFCVLRGVTTIVSDPVELFNPLHDLANALAQIKGGKLKALAGFEVEALDSHEYWQLSDPTWRHSGDVRLPGDQLDPWAEPVVPTSALAGTPALTVLLGPARTRPSRASVTTALTKNVSVSRMGFTRTRTSGRAPFHESGFDGAGCGTSA